MSLFAKCTKCGREHSDGDWAVCHECAGPVFRAWYCGGARMPGEHAPPCGPLPETAALLFGALISKAMFGFQLAEVA